MSGAAPKQVKRAEAPAAPRSAVPERAAATGGISNQLLQLARRGAGGEGAGSDGKPAPGPRMAMAQPRQPLPGARESLVREQLARHAGGGEPLPTGVRGPAERSLEADLSHVRLHRGEGAREVTAAAGARAAQWRNHVFVRPDLYSPQSSEGRKLLGHELVHASQGRGGAGAARALSSPHDPAEIEADKLRSAVLSGVPGAARPSRPASASVSLDPLTDDPADVSALPREVCGPDAMDPDGETTDDTAGEVPAEDDAGMGYCVDPTLIEVSILTNEELILQGIEASNMIASFISTDQETEDWLNLESEIETERGVRVNQGFVFMATAKDAVPTELFQLAPGPMPGTTGIYVAFPDIALGIDAVSLEGVILSKEQLAAYLASSGMAEVGGEEATKVVGLLQAGDGAGLIEHFAAARQPADSGTELADNTTGPLAPPVAASGLFRNTQANDLVTYGPDHWQLPIDVQGVNAMGKMGEASFWTTGDAAWDRYAFNMNHPGHSWYNVLGEKQSKNSPVADFLVGRNQLVDGPFQGIPYSNVTTFRTDQASATRAMMEKFAVMLDIAGRSGATGVAPQNTDMAKAHVQQMAKNSGLAVGSPEFNAAQAQFLSDTMFSVPRAKLTEIRDTVGKPFETRDGSPRPAMLDGYRALYNEALRATPIQATVGGATVTISSYGDLVKHLPNSLRTTVEQTPGGPGAAMLMSPAERARVFDLLGRMASSRIIATEDAGKMIASSDMLRQVGVQGIAEQPTRVLPMDIANFADAGLRIREGLNDPRTPGSAGEYRWRTAQSGSQADNYLSFIRMISGNQALTRDDPEFAKLRAAVTQDIVLSMPVDQQGPLVDALLKSDAALAKDIRAAIAADNPGIDIDTELAEVLKRQTTTFDMTTPELRGTRDYGVNLLKNYPDNPAWHFSADSLALHQNPGLKGVGLRAGRGIGPALWANMLGYGVTAGLDSMTGRDVNLPTFGQGALDLGVSLGTEELERQIGARLLSRVAIENAAMRGLFQKATPGFVLQPIVSVGMEQFSLSSDEELYTRMGLVMTDDERTGRTLHAAGVGLVGAGASAGALYVIGSFTAGGAAAGAPAGGVGAAPGAVVGFLIGAGVVLVGAVAAYGADKALPNSREDYMKEHEAELLARYQKEKERLDAIRSGQLPMQTFDSSKIPLPFRLSKDISVQEQAIIASYLMANAQR